MTDKRDIVYDEVDEAVSNCMSLSEFNHRLPKRIISNGEVRYIEKDIGMLVDKKLADKNRASIADVRVKSKSILIRTSIESSISSGIIEEEERKIENLICRVQIKWIDGSNLFLKMYSTELIGDLKKIFLL